LMNPEVYPEDSGLYKCTATNPHGTAETAAYINIQGPIDYSKGTEDGSASAESAMMPEEPPKFVEKLTAETDGAYDLNYIRLICRVKSFTRATITWWKNDVQLIPGEKYELHEFSDGALILTIHSPTPSDNGIYTCKAESENGLSSTSCEVIVPTRTITTEKVSETQTETETITETVDHSSFEITETSKEDFIATTEITKHEEEYKLLVKVAENVASALVANVFVDAVREAVKKIMEEESEEEEIEVTNAPRFETCIERYVVKENDTVTISTVVTGEPTPFIEWISLAKYDKREGSEQLITNVHAYHTDELHEQSIGVHVPEKESVSGRCSAIPSRSEKIAEMPPEQIQKRALEQSSSQQDSGTVQSAEEPSVVVRPSEQPAVDVQPTEQPPAERKVRSVAVKFAEKLTENVMSQAQTDLRSSVQMDESTIRITEVSGAKILEKGAQETSQAGMTTIDVRKPDIQFDHVVTVVEPEVVQLGLRLPSPSVPSMKFIDLETILQRPGTSSSANTLISSPQRGAANAEHRIVLLEGMSQKFHNAMTLSLKKVKRLATESAEPSSFVQVEIIKPNETSEEVLTIVNAEKLIPDLLRVAAAASKLKMENVTVSLVKQGDAAHQELVIEYESHVEDAANFNLSQLLYESPLREVSSRQETWSRRSRFSDVDENVATVFMEVDANCPDQSVEIVASVSTPLETKVDRSPSSPSPERVEVSESLTESSSATVIGRSAQFKCIVTGMPPPEVAWYVDGDVIHSCREYEIVYEDGVCILRINEAMAEDEGEYSCEAKNSAGKAVTKCYLKVLKDEPPTQPSRRFIQHVPSVVELVDDDAADSFDSFEWEENKANKLFPSDTDSFKGSSITYHSEFDLSRIVNYNEDMEETNAFHRYFDTAIVGITIMEREQRERIYASFLSRPAASAHVNLVIPKPASYSSAAHLFAIPSVHITHADILGPLEKTEVEQMTGKQYEEDPKKTEQPREPDLPLKMSYKGQEIAISVNEIEKEEMILNKVGEIEISKKTCVETSLDFDTELDITQSIRKIRNALPDQTGDLDHVTGHRFEQNTSSHEMSMTLSPKAKHEDLSLKIQPSQGPRLPDRPRAQSAKPMPRLFGDTGKSVSEGAAKLESSMFDPEFLSKMKEIERIARQVDEELGQLSSSPRHKGSPPEDVKEIEEAIYKISDQLMLARPITEAQAEANEELLRTTLADMILNPTRTAAEELELMKRPIQLLKRKLSDLENSLLEDAEVTDITEHPCVATETAILTGETPPILRSQTGPRARIPSADYLRVTPLTSSIKDQLSSLEKMITDHMNGETSDSTEEAAESEVQPLIKSGNHKKHELHDLFVQINNEINTIKTYCRTQLSKKGTDAVMNVLHKVRTHVASIVNVMSLSKKKHPKANRKHTTSVTREFDLERPVVEHQITAVVMAKSFSMDSDYHKSSTAASTSDDTWRYSTELKSSWKGVLRNDVDEESEPPLIATVESTTEEEAPAPVAPPRRRRTRSENTESIEPPTRPPRKVKDLRKRDLSLDDRLTSKRATDTMKPADIRRPPERDNSSPSKTIKSFAGDTIDMLRNLGCVRAQKGDADDLEKSLLEELSQMAVSQSKEEVLSETEWVQSELEQSLKRAAQKAQALSKSDEEQELEPISIYETTADAPTKDEASFMSKLEETVPLKPEQAVDINYAGTSLSAAYLKLSEATAALEIPLTNVMTASGDVGIDDGVSSVQLICEESDYTTDTDTSALLKGTVQFFNRYSPKDATPQSVSSLSVSQRNSKIMPELTEKDESVDIDVNIEFHNSETNEKEDVELLYTEVKVMTKSDEKGKSFRSSIYDSHDPSLEKESVSEDTDHLVLEEAHLSQMVSSEWTDDTDRMTPSSRTAIKETDILSDDSVITEIDRSILDNAEGTFTFFRAREKKAVIAVVYPDVRLFVSARVAENTFDIEIQQEPECLALVIRVIEDQVNFTSLTVMEFTSQQLSAQRTFDELDEASSLEDIDGDSRTGITVSIVARSLHDGIYASLEEIPWGEVEMTLPECENMGKSIEDESKTSLQFNVTVSETNPDERKSIRSQASMELSQNTVSEADNTLSTGSINIPSYVIKMGSTATITCELNNYLPPNSKIDWYKGSTQVVTCPGKLDRISHDLLEVLIINNIEMEDNELYSLKVNDDIFPVAYLIVEAPSAEE
uniref:TITIN protein n=1 Tax=Haemonchus placei TaxID=6290 RepID=A0A0N4W175_HAEPC